MVAKAPLMRLSVLLNQFLIFDFRFQIQVTIATVVATRRQNKDDVRQKTFRLTGTVVGGNPGHLRAQ